MTRDAFNRNVSFSCSTDQLEQLVKETRNFLAEYDDIVLHKELYRTLFMYHLTYLRDEVIQLMKKFTTLPKDVAEEKEIDCCGVRCGKG